MLLGRYVTAQKMKICINDFFSKCHQIRADLVTFTEEIINRKLHFLCSVFYMFAFQIVAELIAFSKQNW